MNEPTTVERPPPPAVDIHPHFFNGYDLPVAGFMRKAVPPFGWEWLGGVVGRPVQWYARRSRSLDAERDDVLRLLGRRPRALGPESRPSKFDLDGALGILLWPWRQSRMFREAHHARVEMIRRLDGYTAGKHPIDLYVPLAVDMEYGAEQQALVSPLEQFDLLALISEASLRGKLGINGVVLPMIAYDPRREDGDPRNNLADVQERVCRGEAIGIKLYPPMGFRPIRNAVPDWDVRLRQLYDWCCRKGVPITAHCSPANAVRDADGFAEAAEWGPVLDEFEGLRLNLAHTGGLQDRDWNQRAIEFLAQQLALGRHVFADVGNHDLTKRESLAGLFASLFRDVDTAARTFGVERSELFAQLMFGSDYWFLTANARPEQFLPDYLAEAEAAIRQRMPADDVDRLIESFRGGAAIRFLQLREHGSGNRTRVVDRIARVNDPVGSVHRTDSLVRILDPTDAELP